MVEILAAPMPKGCTEHFLSAVLVLWSALASMKTSNIVSIVVSSAAFAQSILRQIGVNSGLINFSGR
jgi:hypothetical protein